MPPKRKALSQLSNSTIQKQQRKTTVNPAENPAENPAANPVENPAENPTENIVENLVENPVKNTESISETPYPKKSKGKTKTRAEVKNLPPLPQFEPFKSPFHPHTGQVSSDCNW